MVPRLEATCAECVLRENDSGHEGLATMILGLILMVLVGLQSCAVSFSGALGTVAGWSRVGPWASSRSC